MKNTITHHQLPEGNHDYTLLNNINHYQSLWMINQMTRYWELHARTPTSWEHCCGPPSPSSGRCSHPFLGVNQPGSQTINAWISYMYIYIYIYLHIIIIFIFIIIFIIILIFIIIILIIIIFIIHIYTYTYIYIEIYIYIYMYIVIFSGCYIQTIWEHIRGELKHLMFWFDMTFARSFARWSTVLHQTRENMFFTWLYTRNMHIHLNSNMSC